MADTDPLPPPGSPESRRLRVAAAPEKKIEPNVTREQIPPQPQRGSPTAVAVNARPVSAASQRALDDEEVRERIAEENAARGQIVRVIPELRLPRWLTGGGFLFGIIAILSLVGLFVFSQTITLLAQLAALPTVARLISHVLLAVLLAGIAFGAARLLISYVRLRRTQKITLRGIDTLNERAQFRRLAAEEAEKALHLVQKYLGDFPAEPEALERLGFSAKQAAKLLSSRRGLAVLAEDLPPADWLKRFQQDFQSVVDEAADACIKRHAQRVGLKVAALPWALVDVAVVLRGAFMMIGDLCRIYRLRLGAAETLIVTGWAAVQSVFAGKIEEWTGNKGESWGHDSGQHATGGEAVANSAPDGGAATDAAPDGGAATDAAAATSHILGDIHVPFVGRVFKRATKGVVQGMLLWRLGQLTKRWLRMVE